MKKFLLILLFLPAIALPVTYTTVITDSTGLAQWEDSTDVNLVTAQKVQIAELRGSGFTGHFLFQGAYSNSTYYRKVTVTDSNRTGGSGARLTITTASGEPCIEIRERNFIFDGVKLTAGTADYGVYLATENSDSTCRDCIVSNCEVYSCLTGIFNWCDWQINDGSNIIYNNFVWSCNTSGIRLLQNDSTVYVYNNTVLNSGYGIHLDALDNGVVVASNNICLSNSSNDFQADESFSNSCQANLSTDATAPGGSAMISQTASNVIVSTSTPDLHLKNGSPGIDTGTNLSSTFETDIDGETISGDWARGADFNSEYNRTLTVVYMKPLTSNAWAGQDCVYSTLDSCWDKASAYDEIWIAEGRYDTDTHTFPLTIKSNVNVYGGFQGWETQKDHRGPNWRYMTRSVFDAKRDTNVFISNTSENTSFVLDGLKIVNGHKTITKGGGIFISGSSHPVYATISNCWFDSCSVCETGYPDGPGGAEGGAQGSAINVDNSNGDGGLLEIHHCVAVRCTSICGCIEVMGDASILSNIHHNTVIKNKCFGIELPSSWDGDPVHTIQYNVITGNTNARYPSIDYCNLWAWSSDSTIGTYNFVNGEAWPDCSEVQTGSDWTSSSSTNIFQSDAGSPAYFDSTGYDLRVRGHTGVPVGWGAFPREQYWRIVQ